MSIETEVSPTRLAQFSATNPDHISRKDEVHNVRNGEEMKARGISQQTASANEEWRQVKADKQANGRLPIQDDTKDASEPAWGGTLLAPPQTPHVKMSELKALDAVIANKQHTLDRCLKRGDEQRKRVMACDRACTTVDDDLIEIINKAPSVKLETFVSMHDLDDTTPDDVKRFFASVKQNNANIEGIGRKAPPITDEEITGLLSECDPPLTIERATYAQRGASLFGRKPYLRWKRSPVAGSLFLFPSTTVLAEGAADALSLALWLNRDQVVAELKRQAAEFADKHGVLTPEEYKTALAAAKATKYLAELECAAAWWRVREAGFDMVPPPVSGRALLLIAP